jgi:hypothetical protein
MEQVTECLPLATHVSAIRLINLIILETGKPDGVVRSKNLGTNYSFGKSLIQHFVKGFPRIVPFQLSMTIQTLRKQFNLQPPQD